MTIQWYPGHMAKAERELKERLSLVDVVLELRDARAPRATANPRLSAIVGDKPRLIVLAKADLAERSLTEAWMGAFRREGTRALAVDLKGGRGLTALVRALAAAGKTVAERRSQKGFLARAARAMVVGIPNVGKSSLINRLAGRRAARVGDRPGVTRSLTWIKTSAGIELLDTPGLLWPKLDDPDVACLLAVLGAVAEHRLTPREVAMYAFDVLSEKAPEVLARRYGAWSAETDGERFFERLAEARGLLRGGGEKDVEAAYALFLREIRGGKLGPITWERPEG
ncbi:MAG: ribosome biogenesis GTPase YlqF [Hydrogenibacillus sp.]|nr:ribosome biogenesis GTPase YlqF [Hydrogenibacillus sp.]